MSVLRIMVLPGRLPQGIRIVASGFSMSRNPKPTKKAEALLLKKELTSGAISVTKLEWVRITSSRNGNHFLLVILDLHYDRDISQPNRQ